MTNFDKQLVAPIAPTIDQRNVFLDGLFYDVGALTGNEKEALSSLAGREGSVIVVPPASSSKQIMQYATVAAFVNAERENVRAIAVAGVGSSAIGTAALARNVANVYAIDVAGIVSGYGASDLITEALGGWFFYGAVDSIRYQIREAVGFWEDIAMLNPFAQRDVSVALPKKTLPAARDIDALETILNASPPNLSLLVGHSKGGLLLDFALERFVKRIGKKPHQYFEELRVVTFGAVADLPPHFKRTHQFLGEIDWFGGANSRLDVPHTKLPNAWHHLNTKLPLHVSVEDALSEHVSIW